MPIIPPSDPIGFLVERRFPAARGGYYWLPPDEESLRKIEQYETELFEMPEREFNALLLAEMAKATAEFKVKADLKEPAHFFHQADVNADYLHWSKKDCWTLDEATALSLGKAPEFVTWDAVKGYVGESWRVRFCEGFRMPAHREGEAVTGAGVGKPPGKEPASHGARRCRECYGDFAVVGGLLD